MEYLKPFTRLRLNQLCLFVVIVFAGIGLHVNAHKTEYMCYNQKGDITTLDGTSLKLVDKFTYLGSSVSSTEKDIDTRLTKAWTAIDQLEHTYSSYVRIRDVTLTTSQKRWMIGRSGERGSGISVLAARHDDDDYDCFLRYVLYNIWVCRSCISNICVLDLAINNP